MKKALILHSWFSTPNSNWYPWLKSELEKNGYEVWSPEIPTMPTDSPDMEIMLKFIVDKKFIDKDTIVIGHSLGSVLAMRLGEIVKFKIAILLSNWDYNDLTPEHQNFWKTPVNHALIKSNVDKIVCLISDNDPYVTKIIAHEMAARLGATAIDVGPKGHFLTKDDGVTKVPQILEFV